MFSSDGFVLFFLVMIIGFVSYEFNEFSNMFLDGFFSIIWYFCMLSEDFVYDFDDVCYWYEVILFLNSVFSVIVGVGGLVYLSS